MSFGSGHGKRNPSLIAIVAGSDSSGSINFGADGIESGDVCICFSLGEDNTTTPPPDTTPTGWTKHSTTTVVLGADAARGSVHSKIMDGTENSTDVSPFVSRDGERLWYSVFRPMNCKVVSVVAGDLSMDFDLTGTAPATATVSTTGVSKHFVFGISAIYAKNSSALDLSLEGSYAGTPNFNDDGLVINKLDTDAQTIGLASAKLYRRGLQPSNFITTIGDVADDWAFTYAAFVEIEIS